MQVDYRHGLMPIRPYLLGSGIDAQESAEAAARAGTADAAISSVRASSGAGVAAAAKAAYDRAILEQKSATEAAAAARDAAATQKVLQEQVVSSAREIIAMRSFAENQAARDYYQSLRDSRLAPSSAKKSGIMIAALAAIAYFTLKG